MIDRIMKRKFLYTILAIIIISFIYWLKGHSAPQLIGKTYFSVKTDKKIVALTFDDGPSTPYTEQILDVLKKHNVKATFFLLGSNVVKHPEIVRRIYQEGHDIGNHSWSHQRLVFKTPSYIREEIENTDQAIRNTGFEGTIHFRSPYGNKLIILPLILKSMNRPHILFDIIPKDWELPTAEIITARVMDKLHPGAIILLHDAVGEGTGEERVNTVAALEEIIENIKAVEYEFVTVSKLLEENK